ncbi:molybdopterin-guanine dinucleotide biosynthesis protein B [Candidatus Poribacteria bacterium]|nr:molybdopterin-guanine dinucleotide biosynthesis protein B [Candidatus Poribacteria bacterium]MBT5536239.1 molybdopterin-guanine dinucleotide biosynthesis protein B [Candidatus Poribacteria bacterium]MBT7096637.1 molybdopterin-guanine dinucleotide biosynthesis protein B [Candidatus Poribacteria bacterium]MBT7805285.1 molybdopterin-guanine dinucleotide biosynthesis protein B [Candidatus Poribacteria bacterium]
MICIVGSSGSGKTTVIEGIIPILRREGLRVGTLKHTHHDVPFDTRGKDSWRHGQAGADQAAIVSPFGLAVFDYRAAPPGPEEIIEVHFHDVDIVLVEGYKWGALPKVEVYRQDVSEAPVCVGDPSLLALITDGPTPRDVRRLPSRDYERIAAFIMQCALSTPFALLATASAVG